MASGPIPSWQIDGETVETVTDFIFLGSKITEDGDRSHEIKRCLLLGRKTMKNLDSILKKQRHHFVNKSPYSQSNSFSSSHVQMWDLDHKGGWALKNWCFQTVVLEKTLDSPLESKEINLEYSLEGLILKLKLQYFGHLIRRANSLEKTLMLGKISGRRRREWQRMSWLDGITDSMDREAWCAAVNEVTKSPTWLRDWTTATKNIKGDMKH